MTIIDKKFNNTAGQIPKGKTRDNTSFQGNYSIGNVTDKLVKPLEFEGNTLNRFTFASLAIVFLLGCRYMQARNEDEKREVATRDFSAVITAVYCVPVLKKLIAEGLEKYSGFAILDLNKAESNSRLFNKKLAESHQIKEWYTIAPDENIVNFAQNLSNRGAKLKKVFSKDEEAKKLLREVIGSSEIPDNNDAIIAALKTTQNKQALEKLEKLFLKETFENMDMFTFEKRLKYAKGKTKKVLEQFFGQEYLNNKEKIKQILTTGISALDSEVKDKYKESQLEKGMDVLKKGLIKENLAYRHAQMLKSVPLAAGIITTAGFLGWFLPWFNIHYTRALYKSDKSNTVEKAAPRQTTPPQPVQQTSPVTKTNLSQTQRKLFSNFVN
jgi:hypothetical protein